MTKADAESSGKATAGSYLARQATAANGILLFCAAIMALIPATEEWGVPMSVFLSLSLIFSGATGYCGWLRILSMMPWNSCSRRG